MFVGCKLPHGLTISHAGREITLNGANIGYDPENPWRNGAAPDSALRTSGVGLTEIGDAADQSALLEWIDISGKGPGPVKAGKIFVVDRKADADKEARNLESEKAISGIDPDKDLPAGLETDKDAAKASKAKG